jgi:hypothetical protein
VRSSSEELNPQLSKAISHLEHPIVIPGKLAIAGATRNPGFQTSVDTGFSIAVFLPAKSDPLQSPIIIVKTRASVSFSKHATRK